MRLRLAIGGVTLMCIAIAARVDAAPITFESTPLFRTLPLSFTQDGVTVTFGSTNNGAFFVDTLQNEGGIDFAGSLSGHGLYDVNQIIAPLVISFSAPVSSVGLDFGVDARGSATLKAYLGGVGGTLLATSAFSGSLRDNPFFGYGHATFSGNFDTIVLTRDTSDFGIDNVDFATTAAVPEPASLLLLATGVAGMFGKARRRRRQIAAPVDTQA
jgi:hypothetical protein